MRRARLFNLNGFMKEDNQFEIPTWLPDGAYADGIRQSPGWFCAQLNGQQPLNQTKDWKIDSQDTVWVGGDEPFPYQVGDHMEPEDHGFPYDHDDFGLHRNCVAIVVKVVPHQVQVNWNWGPKSVNPQLKWYKTNQVRKTNR